MSQDNCEHQFIDLYKNSICKCHDCSKVFILPNDLNITIDSGKKGGGINIKHALELFFLPDHNHLHSGQYPLHQSAQLKPQ